MKYSGIFSTPFICGQLRLSSMESTFVDVLEPCSRFFLLAHIRVPTDACTVSHVFISLYAFVLFFKFSSTFGFGVFLSCVNMIRIYAV